MAAEVHMVSIIKMKTLPELHDGIIDRASELGLSMNEYLVRLAAADIQRPDLAHVPRKKMGRPPKKRLRNSRKELSRA